MVSVPVIQLVLIASSSGCVCVCVCVICSTVDVGNPFWGWYIIYIHVYNYVCGVIQFAHYLNESHDHRCLLAVTLLSSVSVYSPESDPLSPLHINMILYPV